MSIRFSGAILALMSIVFIVTIVLFLVLFGNIDSSGVDGVVTTADRARHVLKHWATLKIYWVIEAIALCALAASGFVLKDRPSTEKFPTSWFWVLFAIGAVVNVFMYAFTLGAYPAAAKVVDTTPALYEAMSSASFVVFFLANGLIYLGLSGALLGESYLSQRVLPQAILIPGAIICLVASTLVFMGLFVGSTIMPFAGPFAILGFVVVAVFGAAIARRG